jgi:hypothetical protein
MPAREQDTVRQLAAVLAMRRKLPAAAPQAREQAPAILLARVQAALAALVRVAALLARVLAPLPDVAPELAWAQAAGREPARFRGSRFRAARMLPTPTIHLPLTTYTIAPQTTYGMTVVSTASSGGGLEDFGVFDNERVFTVYIAMKRTPEDADPTWTLQFALLQAAARAGGDPQIAAPSAVMREWPEIPADLEKKYAQRQVVIYAVVDKEGKVSRVSVKQTPDVRVSDPIVVAVNKWVFRPAQLNGHPVAVKILLGIPL